MKRTNGLRATLQGVAVFEALKGLAALAGAAGLLSLLHHDLHHLAQELIGHFDLDPSRHYPALLLDAVDRINATPVHTVVLVASVYVATRWIEAWGLWHDLAWGEWFAALSGAIYLPFEVRHMLHRPGWPGLLVLTVNLLVVGAMIVRLRQRGRGGAVTAG